jgi:plastocyanin
MISFLTAAAAVLAAQGGAAAPANVTVQVSSFSYAPTPIQLAANRPVTLTFVNNSGSGHDFTAKQFFASSSISAGSAPGGEIALKPHETKSITLVPHAGTYHAHCSHFLHAQMGMTDEIIVH